jgi:SAM-dependent methyltransferase
MAWWDSFFDDLYADIGLAHTSVEATVARANLLDRLVAKLHVSPGDTVFDQCCGIGRLALPLAERGMHVIGVDQAASYIARANAEAARRKLPCEFHVGDAFEFVAPRPCDAAFNWFTSFGYDQDDAVNARMLHRAFDSLRPGGWFGLDLLCLPRVLREFREAAVSRHAVAGGELLMLQEPRIDFLTGMIRSDWTFFHPDGTRHTRRVENRAYMPVDLIAMFTRAGFVDIDVCGADNEPFDRMSRRLVVYGRRP